MAVLALLVGVAIGLIVGWAYEYDRGWDDLYGKLWYFQRAYSLFEERSPPDVPRATFVRWCFEAWEKQAEQAAEAAGDDAHD